MDDDVERLSVRHTEDGSPRALREHLVGGRLYDSQMRPDERKVVERAIRRVTEQAANANAIVDEAMDAGLDGSEPFVVNINRPRAELLSMKSDVERELEKLLFHCDVCGRRVHYVGGLGVRAGHRSYAEPAPHETPKLAR
ncbi:MAG: hypothetical protein ACXVP8_00955 [Actinomycetota bacterium]